MKAPGCELGFISDPGNCRPENQDSLIVRRGRIGERREFLLLAVADGMGGMAQGGRASCTATMLLDQWWSGQLPTFLVQTPFPWKDCAASLTAAMGRIDQAIRDQSPAGEKSGTTLSLLFLLDGSYLLKHVGDSRVYLFRKKQAFQLTKDQTWCQREVDEGRLTPAEALTHQMRHVLTDALGIREDFQSQEGFGQAQAGDCLLLCTDGFYNELPISGQTLADYGKLAPQGVLDALLARIKAGPAKDNITAILLRFPKGGWLL